MDRDYLACLAWLGLWPSCGDTGGPRSLLRPASSRARPVPHAQSAWSTALSGLDGPSDSTARLSLVVCPAAPLAQSSLKHIHSPTQSFTHWSLDGRPSYARSLVKHHLRL